MNTGIVSPARSRPSPVAAARRLAATGYARRDARGGGTRGAEGPLGVVAGLPRDVGSKAQTPLGRDASPKGRSAPDPVTISIHTPCWGREGEARAHRPPRHRGLSWPGTAVCGVPGSTEVAPSTLLAPCAVEKCLFNFRQ